MLKAVCRAELSRAERVRAKVGRKCGCAVRMPGGKEGGREDVEEEEGWRV